MVVVVEEEEEGKEGGVWVVWWGGDEEENTHASCDKCKNAHATLVAKRQISADLRTQVMDKNFWMRTCQASDNRSLAQQQQAVYIAGGVTVCAVSISLRPDVS